MSFAIADHRLSQLGRVRTASSIALSFQTPRSSNRALRIPGALRCPENQDLAKRVHSFGESEYANYFEPLKRIVDLIPEVIAYVFPDERDGTGCPLSFSYRDLDDLSTRAAAVLRSKDICDGSVTLLMAPPSSDLICLAFGSLKAAAVPVLLPGLRINDYKKVIDDVKPDAYIGIGITHALQKMLGWGKGAIRKRLLVGRCGCECSCGVSFEELMRREEERFGGPRASLNVFSPITRESVAAVISTTGTTGIPKCAVYTHRNFLAQWKCCRSMGISPGDIDCGFTGWSLLNPLSGITSVVKLMVPAVAKPEEIANTVQKFGATVMFMSPRLLERVGEWAGGRCEKFKTVRQIYSGGGDVSKAMLAKMKACLQPGAQVITILGATEVLPIATIEADEVLGESGTWTQTELGAGICVGHIAFGLEVKIVELQDELVTANREEDQRISDFGQALLETDQSKFSKDHVGEIVVHGTAVSESYLCRPDLTLTTKIRDAKGGLWHRTGDMGYLDDQKRLWICGRKSDRVVVQDETLLTLQVEGIFNSHPQVKRSALVVEPKGQKPVLCIQRQPVESNALSDDELKAELAMLAATHRIVHIGKIYFHKEFPVDLRHNSKIERTQLRQWVARKSWWEAKLGRNKVVDAGVESPRNLKHHAEVSFIQMTGV